MTEQPPKVLTPRPDHDDWLTEEEVRGLTVEKVVTALEKAGESIAADAEETERQRHPTEAAWSAVRKSGLFYLLVPEEFGGVGVDRLDALVDPVLVIAEQCASTAWCAMQCMEQQWMVSLFPEEFQREVWGRLPYLTAAGSAFPMGAATRVDGGFRVTGRYRWGSGILYAQWVYAFALTEEADGNSRPYLFFVPIEDVTILDTWFVDGMAGTGSHDFVVSDVFVPEHRALDAVPLFTTGRLDKPNPIQRVPLPVFLATFVSIPILGAARSVVKAHRDRLIGARADNGSTLKSADPTLLARADTSVRLAELALRSALAEIHDHLEAAAPIPEDVRSSLRAQVAYSVDLARTAARSIGDVSGSSAHLLANPIQRAVRDVNMLSTHVAVEFSEAMDFHGRQLIGMPVTVAFEDSAEPSK